MSFNEFVICVRVCVCVSISEKSTLFVMLLKYHRRWERVLEPRATDSFTPWRYSAQWHNLEYDVAFLAVKKKKVIGSFLWSFNYHNWQKQFPHLHGFAIISVLKTENVKSVAISRLQLKKQTKKNWWSFGWAQPTDWV